MKAIAEIVDRSMPRRWAAGLMIVALLCATSATADVGATGLATVVCVPTLCCGQIQFDNQTYSVFGNSYNIVGSGVSAVASSDTAIVLAEEGGFSGTWTQYPSGSFSFGASGSFLCPNPGEFCVGPPVAFVGDVSNPTFPPVLTQYAWTLDGSMQFTTAPIGSVPPTCGLGFVYEGLVALNAFLVGEPTPTGNGVIVTIPVSYFDSFLGETFDHTVQVFGSEVTTAGTTSATAFSSAPGQVLPGFAVRVGGSCNGSLEQCASNADCPSGQYCFGSFNGGYVDVSTDATYTPPIDVCITLDPDWLVRLAYYGLDLDDVRFAHEESGTFRNRTVSRNPATNTICARVNSFSFFALGVASCPETPLTGCRTAEKSKLSIKDSVNDASDKLSWKWLKGAETTQAEFADPTGNADYELCVYSGSPGTLIDQAVVAAHGGKWAAVSDKGFRYTDATSTSTGVFSAKLYGGEPGKSKVLVKAKGEEVRDLAPGTLPIPSADFPVRAQLLNTANGTCWESSYAEADAMKNDESQFNAKSVTP